MSRKPLIAGNWKMNMDIKTADEFAKNVLNSDLDGEVEALICAPFTILPSLSKDFDGKKIALGAQNMHFEKSGAFTGEISADMLKEIGIKYVIIGHSERRQYFAETDETCNLKLRVAFENGIMPVLCVGESLEQYEAGKTKEIVENQVKNGLKGIDEKDILNLVIAYEPIWAIGTGKTATSDDANETIKYIRKTVSGLYSEDVSSKIRILYGGSVKPSNISELMATSDIDGALVGGASLKSEDFISLVNYKK